VADETMTELKPRVVDALEQFDYSTRVAALRLMGCGDQISAALDDTMSHPKLRDILMLLAHMAFGGLIEYYGGSDTELAGWTVSRAVVATLGMRWPQPPMSGAAAQALEHRTGKTFRQPAQDDTAVCR
jgi:hypothetical protein